MNRLRSSTIRISSLTWSDRERMFSVMSRYYESITRTQFDQDLDEKTAVILLRDEKSRQIQGFSTLHRQELKLNGQKAIGIFSGDTIIEKEFWGQKALGVEFLKYLWLEKIKRPFNPLYWFLISKGYKTYLLMANNFAEYYPRHELQTPPPIRQLMDEFYESKYPGHYDASSGRILFEDCAGKLKDGVAEIDAELIRKNPRIAYFQSRNPGWKFGDELACIARMTFWMPFQFQIKILKKSLLGSLFSRAAAPLSPPLRGTALHFERRQRQEPVRVERRGRGMLGTLVGGPS